jgi:hypothetical protein
MDTTANAAATHQETFVARLQKVAIGVLFALVLLVPKILLIRRDERSWTAFRILLGLAGAGFVILPLAFWNSWLAAIFGLAMFLTAALLPPAQPTTLVDDKAKELGALVVVNGGNCQMESGIFGPVRLFVGPDKISVLDPQFRPVLAIPTAEITSVHSEEARDLWLLRIRWANHLQEFSYTGIFAEHLARVAETTIRNVIRTPLPVLSRSRAAGA